MKDARSLSEGKNAQDMIRGAFSHSTFLHSRDHNMDEREIDGKILLNSTFYAKLKVTK